jgi:5'-methylthioadenosine phosphorylase
MTTSYTLGVIGGSGLYRMAGLTEIEELWLDTPFGAPSDAVVRGRIGSTPVLFLARHGKGHRLPPHAINARANVCALKRLGATHLVSVSAVGSMRENMAPGDLVVVDQFVDRTSGRPSTFFDAAIVAHVAFAEPVCGDLSAALFRAARTTGARVHEGGTYICIDGPQFSTRAESLLYRSWGVSVVGMTAMPEARLAREAELPYALLALVTDYDCWHQGEPSVDAASVLSVIQANAGAAQRVIAELAPRLPDPSRSVAAEALRSAFIGSLDDIPPDAMTRLDWLVAKYLPRSVH